VIANNSVIIACFNASFKAVILEIITAVSPRLSLIKKKSLGWISFSEIVIREANEAVLFAGADVVCEPACTFGEIPGTGPSCQVP
jgi:hypothetical protein